MIVRDSWAIHIHNSYWLATKITWKLSVQNAENKMSLSVEGPPVENPVCVGTATGLSVSGQSQVGRSDISKWNRHLQGKITDEEKDGFHEQFEMNKDNCISYSI